MCRLRKDVFTKYTGSYGTLSIGTPPIPQVAWAVPVNPAELGAHLQAYLTVDVPTIRECHQSSQSRIARLPLELLDIVLEALQRPLREEYFREWNLDYECFQQIADSWHFAGDTSILCGIDTIRLFKSINPQCKGMGSLSHISEDEMTTQIHGWSEGKENGLGVYPDIVYDTASSNNYDRGFRWLYRTCSCTGEVNGRHREGPFFHFNEALKDHFGLEAVICHETASDGLGGTAAKEGEKAHNTVCFLTTAEPVRSRWASEKAWSMEPSRKLAHQYPSIGDVSVQYEPLMRRIVDPSSIVLNNDMKVNFKNAMEDLDLKPYFTLTDAEIYQSEEETSKYVKEVEEGEKNLRNQEWPQLFVFSPATITVPGWTPARHPYLEGGIAMNMC